MGSVVAIEEDLDVGQSLQEDATDFYCTDWVPQVIDFSDRDPPTLDKDVEVLPCSPRYLLQALRRRRRHHPNTRRRDPLEWVPRDVLFEYVWSWWSSGRSWGGT